MCMSIPAMSKLKLNYLTQLCGRQLLHFSQINYIVCHNNNNIYFFATVIALIVKVAILRFRSTLALSGWFDSASSGQAPSSRCQSNVRRFQN